MDVGALLAEAAEEENYSDDDPFEAAEHDDTLTTTKGSTAASIMKAAADNIAKEEKEEADEALNHTASSLDITLNRDAEAKEAEADMNILKEATIEAEEVIRLRRNQILQS